MIITVLRTSSGTRKLCRMAKEFRRIAKYEIEEKEQKSRLSYYGRTLELPTVLRYTATAKYSGTAAKAVPSIDPETKGMFEATAVYTLKEIARPTEPPQDDHQLPVPIRKMNYTPYIVAGAAGAGGSSCWCFGGGAGMS